MPKQCLSIGCKNNVYSHLYCQFHQSQRTDSKWLKAIAVKRLGATVKRPSKPIAKASKKRQEINSKYSVRAKRFKIENPLCKARLEGCTIYTTDIHHMQSRGINLLDESKFLPVCRSCHNWITEHSQEAIELGLSISKFKK